VSRRARLVAGLALGLLPGCTSQWYMGGERAELVTTVVRVDTEPQGAVVYFNGVRQAAAPVRIPVEYDHVEQLWSRQNNRFLVYHYREDRRRHVYGNNVHTVAAHLPGHVEAEQVVTLEGQEEVAVTLRLPRE
jgi:hypothetical protein